MMKELKRRMSDVHLPSDDPSVEPGAEVEEDANVGVGQSTQMSDGEN